MRYSELLQRHKRVTYRALKRQFGLDDAYLEDLKAEIIEARQLAVDQGGTMLVWCGDLVSPPPPAAAPVSVQNRAPLTYTPRHLAEKILTSRSALEGERKQVTVLFADMAGFTTLAEQLDPEVVHDIINRCFEGITAEVHRFEGTINQYTGDGVMALFGAPLAHEDSPRRAVHAALGIQRAIRDVAQALQAERGLSLQMRIGVNTGLVVVGKIGDDLRMDYTAVGDTTNLAARLSFGGGIHPGRAHRRRHAAAHAGDGTDDCTGTSKPFRRSVVSPWGRRMLLAGRLEEAHALAERRWHSPVRTRNVAIRRMPCASSARSLPTVFHRRSSQAEAFYRQALALADALGMRPLLAHCHYSLGILYNRVGCPEQARTELSAAIELYRAMEMTFWLERAEIALVQGRERGK